MHTRQSQLSVRTRCRRLLLLLATVALPAWAGPNDLFQRPNADVAQVLGAADAADRDTLTRIRQQPAVAAFEVLSLRKDYLAALRRGDAVVVNIFGRDVRFVIARAAVRDADHGEWYAAERDTGDTLTLSLRAGKLTGSVRAGSLYSLQSVGAWVAVTQIDETQLREHEGRTNGTLRAQPGQKLPRTPRKTLDLNTGALSLADDGSVIRVLVAYTPAAAAAVANINDTIALAVTETNQSYLNSGITTRVELAHGYQTAYTESGDIVTDLSRFENTSDGIMDEAHTLRDQHLADVALLILSNNGNYCGLASQIMANAATAFAAVRASCATGYYSFAHEIGHLQGARHNIDIDPSTLPFADGHGYCQPNVSFGWRTIMAYGCANGDGPRIQYWSNPNNTYQGVAMGVAGSSNNVRVLNETDYTVANFRSSAVPPPGNVWSLAYSWGCNGSYAKSEWRLNTDGTFTDVPSGAGGRWFENHNNAVFTFASGTRYSGRHQGKSITGVMRSAGGLDGCWYAHPKGTVADAPAVRGEYDAVGVKLQLR